MKSIYAEVVIIFGLAFVPLSIKLALSGHIEPYPAILMPGGGAVYRRGDLVRVAETKWLVSIQSGAVCEFDPEEVFGKFSSRISSVVNDKSEILRSIDIGVWRISNYRNKRRTPGSENLRIWMKARLEKVGFADPVKITVSTSTRYFAFPSFNPSKTEMATNEIFL